MTFGGTTTVNVVVPFGFTVAPEMLTCVDPILMVGRLPGLSTVTLTEDPGLIAPPLVERMLAMNGFGTR